MYCGQNPSGHCSVLRMVLKSRRGRTARAAARQGGNLSEILRNTNEDEPESPQPREIRRNCGQLLGGLDEILPCLYLAEGVSIREMRQRESKVGPGFFAIGKRTDSHVSPNQGLVLPVNLCRDEQARAILLKLPFRGGLTVNWWNGAA